MASLPLKVAVANTVPASFLMRALVVVTIPFFVTL